jgi:hypothetical protein
MDVGMMWFDPDPRSAIGEKVQRAAAYYRGKYGRAPTLCYIHPVTAGESSSAAGNGLEVRTSRSVLPNHFWLGLGEPKPGAGTARSADGGRG